MTPAPLTPAESDLQDFAFMPLHVARLRDSDLAAEGHPEACWYAVLLWSASWHQLPAGSLPNNDAVLARLCGLGRDMRTFARRRDEAMRGWTLCSDGRLYHPVVAEQVNSSWAEKLAYRDRKAKRVAIAANAAEARWGKSSGDADADASSMHDASKDDAPSTAPEMLKGTGKGRGTGNYQEDAEASSPVKPATSKPSKPRWPKAMPPPGGVSDDQWAGFVAHRLAKRTPLTDRAYDLLIGKLAKAPSDEWPPGRIIDTIVERGWVSFEMEWLTKGTGASNGKLSHHDRPSAWRSGDLPAGASAASLDD